MCNKNQEKEQELEKFKTKLRQELVELLHHPRAVKETRKVLRRCIKKLID